MGLFITSPKYNILLNNKAMLIRKATIKDSESIISLMKELIDLHAGFDSSYKRFSEYSKEDLRTYIDETADSKDKIILIAEDGKKILGYFIGEITEAPYYSKEKKIGVVADTVVDPRNRATGILTAMLEEAQKWFAKKKVNFVELSVDARNSDAIAAWRKLGFENYKLRLRKSL